jgi:branched-chain amino acid transport system ATP-binding protein
MADAILEVRRLDVRYGHSHILQGVDLVVGAEPLSLIGRNGMGKTTLCNAITGLVPRGLDRLPARRSPYRCSYRPARACRRGVGSSRPLGRRAPPMVQKNGAR